MIDRPTQPAARTSRFTRLLAACALAVAAALGIAPGARAQIIRNELPEQVRGLELQDNTGNTIPLDLQFTDSSGKPVRLGDLFNRPGPREGSRRPVVVVMMYFRCPLLCPKVVEETIESFRGLDDLTVGTDYDALFVSFDPRDQPIDAERKKNDALMAYERTIDDSIRAGMSFLTGPAANSRALADALGFPYRYLPDSGEYSHGAVIIVLTPDGTISRYLTGLTYPVRDLRLALVEAADGRIGSLTDRFLLWCYHFDPSQGGYVLRAMRLMQAAGAATVLLLGGFIGWLFYAERHRWVARRLAAGQGGGAREAGGTAGEGGQTSDQPGEGTSP